jgi:hypothetical protein
VETGLTLAWDSGSSFVDMPLVPKGIIWLFLATFAEVTPAVFISLNLNGRFLFHPI